MNDPAPLGRRLRRVLVLTVVVALLAGGLALQHFWVDDYRPSPGLAGILEDGRLVVLSTVSPTTAYQIDGEWQGYEYDLARRFAEHLGVEAEFRYEKGIDGVLVAVEDGRGHLAAAGLTVTEARRVFGTFGPEYREVTVAVVCSRDVQRPRSLQALVDYEVAIPARSSYVRLLEKARARIPALSWTEVPGVATEGLFAAVEKGRYECTLADSNIVAINHLYHPEMRRAFDLESNEGLAWLVAPASGTGAQGDALMAELERFFETVREDGYLATLEERYYAHLGTFDYVEVARFERRIRTRLPKYIDVFHEAAAQTGFPWIVLAAQSYQESRWNPKAKSPTGVRGMMMLTRPTAREVGVENRLDPKASILGGARYLKKIHDRLPDGLSGQDRLWAALAAYNVGFGHLLDARVLAERRGLDKNAWKDLREVLPLLSKREYYETVRRGFARGGEPVIYVDRIREFAAILNNQWRATPNLAETPAPPATDR